MEHPLTPVYITADALFSSLGFGTQENLEAIRNYQSGISLRTDGCISASPLLAATIDRERLHNLAKAEGIADHPRMEQLFILAIRSVLSQSGVSLEDPDCGLILSTTKGNIDLLGGQTSEPDERVFLATMAERIGAYFGGYNSVEVISNACISGVSALIVAKRQIESGMRRRVIVAGGDILSHFITSGFLSFRSVSKNRCLPYDARRDGLNLGEACGAVLLSTESTPDAILLAGGAISNDANHISGPSRTGDGLYFAIRQAMNEAQITPEEVSFVNTHGTATVYNDEMESKALHLVGLQSAPVQSLKPYFGHTLGASGIIESIICMHELKEGTLFATLGYEEPGVPMPLVISGTHQQMKMTCCVKTASGFGGCNAALLLVVLPARGGSPGDGCRMGTSPCGKHRETPGNTACRTSPCGKHQTVSIGKCRLCFNGVPVALSPNTGFSEFIRAAYKNLGESNMKFYKMDDLCKLGYVAAAYLLKGKSFLPEEIGILLANASASLDTDIRHQAIIDKDGDEAASPAVFVYTLPNVVAGEICIRHKIQGENTFFIRKEYNPSELEQYASIVMAKGKLKACIIGWCELLGESYNAEFKLIETE